MLALALLGIVLLVVYGRFGVGIPCPLHLLTGLYCPGCGTMRALHSLSQFRWQQALQYNALSLFLLPILAAQGVRQAWHYVRGTRIKQTRLEKALWLVLLGLALLYGALRNLPYFAVLRPGP